MSDTSQGPGWWQASDGKWYPPESVPGSAPTAPPPPGYGPPPQPGAMPVGGAPGYAAPPMAYGPAPKQGMNGCLKAFLIVFVICAVLGVAATVAAVFLIDDAVDDLEDFGTDADEIDDVDDIDCDTDEFGNLSATITVVNDSSDRSNYVVTVAWEDSSGSQLATGTAFINAVRSDQRAEGQASAFIDAPEGFVTCEVVTVERFSDESGD